MTKSIKNFPGGNLFVCLFIFFSAKSEYLKKIVNSTFLTVYFIFLKITGVLFMSENMHVFFQSKDVHVVCTLLHSFFNP